MTSSKLQDDFDKEFRQHNGESSQHHSVPDSDDRIGKANDSEMIIYVSSDQTTDVRTGSRKWIRVDKWFAGAVIASTITQGIFSVYQWKEANKQTAIMLGQMQDAREGSRDSAAQAQAALEASIEIARSDQRAWVGFQKPILEHELTTGTLHVRVPAKNSGKTPARITSNIGVVFCTQNTNITHDSFNKVIAALDTAQEAGGRDNIIPPDNILKLPVRQYFVTEKNLYQIQKGEAIMFIIIRIIYYDITNKERVTRACFVYDHKTKEFMDSNKYGQMD